MNTPLPSLHDYNVKVPDFTFCRGWKDKTTLLFFYSELWYSLLEFNSKKIANLWRIKRDGISAIKFQAARIHFLSDVFVVVAVVPLLKLPKFPSAMHIAMKDSCFSYKIKKLASILINFKRMRTRKHKKNSSFEISRKLKTAEKWTKHLPLGYVTIMFFSVKLVIKKPGLHQQLYQIW